MGNNNDPLKETENDGLEPREIVTNGHEPREIVTNRHEARGIVTNGLEAREIVTNGLETREIEPADISTLLVPKYSLEERTPAQANTEKEICRLLFEFADNLQEEAYPKEIKPEETYEYKDFEEELQVHHVEHLLPLDEEKDLEDILSNLFNG